MSSNWWVHVRKARQSLALLESTFVQRYTSENLQGKSFIWIRALCLVAVSVMLIRTPPPGVAVALLAVVAALMTLHERQGTHDKASWSFLVLILLAVESRSIFQARTQENDRVIRERSAQEHEFLTLRQSQNDSFLQTMHEIDQSIDQGQKHFTETIQTVNALLKKADDLQIRSKENLNATTGGDSFAYVMYTPWGVPPYLKAQGKYPIHDLKISFIFMDLKKGLFIPLHNYNAGAVGANEMNQLLTIQLKLPESDHWKVMTYFDALNGHWFEETFLQKVGNDWYESFTVRTKDKNGVYQIVLEVKDPRVTDK